MDGTSHKLFAERLLAVCGLDAKYTVWGVAPDKIELYIHRWQHRFSKMYWLYNGFSLIAPVNENPVDDDKRAIALCIVSHYYLDMFNAVLPAFGGFPPFITINVPNENVQELVKDLNVLTNETPIAFCNEESELFDELEEGSADDYMKAMITSLCRHTYPIRPNINMRAWRYIEDFIGEGKLWVANDLTAEMDVFTLRYEDLIKLWCEKI